MHKIILIYLVILAIFAFAMIDFLFASDADAILVELKRLNIMITDAIEPQEIEIPVKLIGPYWGVLAGVCKQGGYNLSAYAGKKVKTVNLPVADISSGPLDVVVFSCGNKIACVYLLDKEAAPGMIPVGNL